MCQLLLRNTMWEPVKKNIHISFKMTWSRKISNKISEGLGIRRILSQKDVSLHSFPLRLKSLLLICINVISFLSQAFLRNFRWCDSEGFSLIKVIVWLEPGHKQTWQQPESITQHASVRNKTRLTPSWEKPGTELFPSSQHSVKIASIFAATTTK